MISSRELSFLWINENFEECCKIKYQLKTFFSSSDTKKIPVGVINEQHYAMESEDAEPESDVASC